MSIRLSIAPLEAALNGRDEILNARLQQAVYKGRRKGYISLDMADEIACHALKTHPFHIWGAEYEAKVWHDIDDPDIGEECRVIVFPTLAA